MRYCVYCGKQIDDDSSFCPYCGKPVQQEESLISRARRGDNEAIQQIMNQYSGMVRYQARMYVKNEDDVNEIEQQVFIKAFDQKSTLDDEKKFGGWLKTIAINTSRSYVTTAFRKRSVMFTDLDDTNNDMVYDAEDERIDHRPDVQMDESSRREIILKVLDSLPETQRMVIVMHYYDNLSFKDIAEQLNIPMSTVTGRAQQAKNSIKASVTDIQNREGIKLYSLAPLAYFLWLLMQERTSSAIITAPVIEKTVKVEKADPSAKEKDHYGRPDEKRSSHDHQNPKRPVQKTTGKGTGFFATTTGKVIIASAIAIASFGGGAASGTYYRNHHLRNTETAKAPVSHNTEHPVKKTSEPTKKPAFEDRIVWISEPGTMNIDDYENIGSSSNMYPYSNNDYEHTGYSPTWMDGSYHYTGDAIITRKNGLMGINNYEGQVIDTPIYTYIKGNNTGMYVISTTATSSDGASFHDWFDENFKPVHEDGDMGGTDYRVYCVLSNRTLYDAYGDSIAVDDPSVVSSSAYLIGTANYFDPNDVDYDFQNYDYDGYAVVQNGRVYNIPTGMTPVADDSAECLDDRFVNGVVKLKHNNGQIYLWNYKTQTFISNKSYDDATFYEDGYIGVKKDGKWAFMDINGNIVTDYVFDKVSGLYEGKAYVTYKGKIGIIDLQKTLRRSE